MSTPKLRFLSLFVPDLDRATEAYQALLGLAPTPDPTPAPAPHPFSPRPPVVFDLGQVKLALYQTDERVTHAGDVGIGLCSDEPRTLLETAQGAGGQVLLDSSLSVFVMPDRHFFEVVDES